MAAQPRRKNPGLVMITNPGPRRARGAEVSESDAWDAVADYVKVLRRDAVHLRGNGPQLGAEVLAQATSLYALVNAMRAQLRAGVHTNPRQRNPSGRKMSNHVQAIVYDHLTEGPRVHGFGNADPALKERGDSLTMTGLHDVTNVAMYAEPDGSIRLRHNSGKPLWFDDKED